MRPLPRSFYGRDTVTVARDLLGKTLVRRIGGRIMSGIITETEAYRHSDDPASHAYGGMTKRNMAMFGEVGRAYVYFTYGMHYCVNAVAKSGNFQAGAVLIRAAAPVKGAELMASNRKGRPVREISNGPAKLTQAMQISGEQYGADLTIPAELFITQGIDGQRIAASGRIGIRMAAEKRWNFKINVGI